MPQRKIPAREIINFIVKARNFASQESDDKKQLMLVRKLANRMFQNYIGYNHRGEYRIKARGEMPFLESVAAHRAYDERWALSPSTARPVEVKFLGHSGFRFTGSSTLYIDPHLTGNRSAPMNVEAVTKADIVLVTHDHPAHRADALTIARRTRARLVGITGLAESEPGIRFEPMNLGGKLQIEGVTLHMVPAVHAAHALPAAGYVVQLDGYTIYHAGDTALYGDMKYIGDEFELDLALLPIGDRFTMGPREAARATALLRPRFVVPMHFNGRPELESDPEEFRLLVADAAEVRLLQPGDALTLDRRPHTEDVAKLKRS